MELNRRTFVAGGLGGALASSPALQAAGAAPLMSSLDVIAKDYISAQNAPGMIVGRADSRGWSETAAYGFADVDVIEGLANPKTDRMAAYTVYFYRNEYAPVDDAIKTDLAFLQSQHKGEFRVYSRTCRRQVARHVRSGHDAGLGLGLRWRAKRLTELYTPRPEWVGVPLVAMETTDIPTRDGSSPGPRHQIAARAVTP